MKKQYLMLTIVLIFGLKSWSQELTCADFKVGKFFIPETEELKEYTIISNDSIKKIRPDRDSTIRRYVIIRKKNTQTEWENGINIGAPDYAIIEWIDDCTYRLTYDSSKKDLDQEKKWVNENNGIVVSKTKIEGNCLFYNATMTTNAGQKISQNGVICKE